LDDIISPIIHFTINPKENEDPNITIKKYADLIDLSEDECILNNYKVVKKGDVFVHNDYNNIIYETEYLFDHPEIKKPEMVEMFFLYIEYVNFFLGFSMTQCRNRGEIAIQ